MADEAPCFRCPLPDCDETSPKCALRQINSRYYAKIRAGEHDSVLPVEHIARNEIFQIWHLERMTQASEGTRPYQRYRGDRHGR